MHYNKWQWNIWSKNASVSTKNQNCHTFNLIQNLDPVPQWRHSGHLSVISIDEQWVRLLTFDSWERIIIIIRGMFVSTIWYLITDEFRDKMECFRPNAWQNSLIWLTLTSNAQQIADLQILWYVIETKSTYILIYQKHIYCSLKNSMLLSLSTGTAYTGDSESLLNVDRTHTVQ